MIAFCDNSHDRAQAFLKKWYYINVYAVFASQQTIEKGLDTMYKKIPQEKSKIAPAMELYEQGTINYEQLILVSNYRHKTGKGEQELTLSGITMKTLSGLEKIIVEFQPNIVLVHGDTTTAFAAAMAAFYQQTAVGHVEAGLRTWKKYSPFPEEMNRQMIDCMADLYFAPTEQSRQNLLGENRNSENIYVTGNTAIDALKTTIRSDYRHPVLELCQDSRILLLTVHRRENMGEPMRNIFRAVRRITEVFHDVSVHLIQPLDVIDFHNFINRSYLILTDSGGIQEEAPSLGKPVLVLRETTERPEGVQCGTLKLTGIEENSIYKHTKELLIDPLVYSKMSRASNPYGDGRASQRITNIILECFK